MHESGEVSQLQQINSSKSYGSLTIEYDLWE